MTWFSRINEHWQGLHKHVSALCTTWSVEDIVIMVIKRVLMMVSKSENYAFIWMIGDNVLAVVCRCLLQPVEVAASESVTVTVHLNSATV